MEVSPSEENFYLSIWYLLEEINSEVISSFNEEKKINISLSADITLPGPKGPYWQERALEHLKEKGIIRDFGERIEVLIKDGQKTIAYLSLPCTVSKDFFDYYRNFKKIVKDNLFDKLTVIYGKEIIFLDYETLSGHKYSGQIGRDTNPHKLIMFLLTHPDKIYKFENLEEELNINRSKLDNNVGKRVRDALATIKKNMKLIKNENFIFVKNGVGLKPLIIEIKPETKKS